MSQYFDKDFWKFLIAFAAIILLSCAIILAARLYQSRSADTSLSVLTNRHTM